TATAAIFTFGPNDPAPPLRSQAHGGLRRRSQRADAASLAGRLAMFVLRQAVPRHHGYRGGLSRPVATWRRIRAQLGPPSGRRFPFGGLLRPRRRALPRSLRDGVPRARLGHAVGLRLLVLAEP